MSQPADKTDNRCDHQAVGRKRKKILYVDLDNTLVDFKSGIKLLHPKTKRDYTDRYDDVPGIFATMKPIKGAVESFEELSHLFDAYILSTAPWNNPIAWSDKALWVQRYFGAHQKSRAYKRLILSHHKNLNHGDFIIDDRTHRGVSDFNGEHIHFGTKGFKTWPKVVDYLRPRA